MVNEEYNVEKTKNCFRRTQKCKSLRKIVKLSAVVLYSRIHYCFQMIKVTIRINKIDTDKMHENLILLGCNLYNFEVLPENSFSL